MPLLNDRSTALSLLATRRSSKARTLTAPGPCDAEIATILTSACRVPDHGRLTPWRFVHIPQDQRPAFADALQALYQNHKPDASAPEREAVRLFATQSPCLIVVLSRVSETKRIPAWEQHLSAGAACQNLLLAAHAQGYLGCWLTGWACYDPAVVTLLGGDPATDQIAGFLFLGSGSAPEERPRPTLDQVSWRWSGDVSARSGC